MAVRSRYDEQDNKRVVNHPVAAPKYGSPPSSAASPATGAFSYAHGFVLYDLAGENELDLENAPGQTQAHERQLTAQLRAGCAICARRLPTTVKRPGESSKSN